nr:proline dehydrogenase family protein [Caldalkalibacillus mannanilyticus]
MNISNEARRAAHALKVIARNEQIKEYIQHSEDLYPLLLKGAKRFVAGETRKEGIQKAEELIQKGYQISVEYIGENTKTLEECIEAKNECIALTNELRQQQKNVTISLDLSHIGLTLDPALAVEHLQEIAKVAQIYGHTVMVSMEESQKTEEILEVYKTVTAQSPHVGITVQAHLHRTPEDLADLLNYPGKIRLVKGAYQESAEVAIPRSKELNKRYFELVTTLIEANHPVSIATHDEELIQKIVESGYIHLPHVECEMLYGIRPDLIRSLKEQGAQAQVYVTYGSEWYLYLCHRIAEFPPNLYRLLSDIINPPEAESALY